MVRQRKRKVKNFLMIFLIISIFTNVVCIYLFYQSLNKISYESALVSYYQNYTSSLESKIEILESQLDYYKSLLGNLSLEIYGENFTSAKKVNVTIVAVKEIPTSFFEYTYEGVIMQSVIEITPGEGRILVNTNPSIGIELQSSLKVARYVAQRFTNKSLASNDIIVNIYGKEKVNVVDGPSAGSMLTIALIIALENKTILEKFSGTGTIRLDGSIGEIGAIEEKAIAVAKEGIKYFFVPKSQEYVYIKVPKKKERIGSFVIITYGYEKVKLEDYLKNKGYNITVIGVSNINEFYNYLINLGIIE